jgi:hypothetical protein
MSLKPYISWRVARRPSENRHSAHSELFAVRISLKTLVSLEFYQAL